MKTKPLYLILLLLTGLAISCGKPKDAVVLIPDAPDTGGYTVVARYTTPAYAQDVALNDTLLYVAQGEGGLLIMDVSDPYNPKQVSIVTENARGYSLKVAYRDSAVYLAAGGFGVTAINAANPYNPFVTAYNLQMKPARDIHLMGNYMFTAVSEVGVRFADIHFPLQPDVFAGIEPAGYAYGCTTTADSNFLVVACGEMGISVFDISDIQNGQANNERINWCNTPGYAQSVALTPDDKYAFVACGIEGLQIVDISDTTNYRIVGSFDYNGYIKSLVYRDGLVYLAAELYGLQIVDVSDVTAPRLIGQIASSYALDMDMDDKYIYVADEVEGIIVIAKPGVIIID
jgi:hypothetical protein